MKKFKSIIRMVLAVISAGLFLWFLLPMAKRIICVGNVVGVLFTAFVFCRCVFYKYFQKLKEKWLMGGFKMVLYRIIQVCIALFLVYGVVISGLMAFFTLQKPEPNSTIITLGAMVRPDGSPSGSLNRRVQACYEYLVENENSKAVLSGGQGSNEPMSEAQCMYDILVKKGISKDRLFIEDKSTNTDSNLINSYKIIEKNNLSENIAIATDGYHQLRARIIANRQGKSGKVGAVNAKPIRSVIVTYWVREWFAIPVELLK